MIICRSLTVAAAMALMRLQLALASPPPDLVQMVIAGNWPVVAQRVSHISQPDAVVRVLAGHAYLAGNRANEAVCAFASVTTDVDRAAWLSWTRSLAAAHSALAAPHYLYADALARQEQWAAARDEFDRALAIAPGTPLYLNARALAAAGALDWKSATRDLTAASKVIGAPIDIRVNQAALTILRRDDAGAADARFKAILDDSPNHGIALIGRGVAAVVMRDWRAAETYYSKAAAATPCLPLAAENRLLAQEAELAEQHAALLAANNPGASILLGPAAASQVTASQMKMQAAQTQTQAAMSQFTSTTSSNRQDIIAGLQNATIGMQIWNGGLATFKSVADTMNTMAVAAMGAKMLPMTPQTGAAVAGLAFTSSQLGQRIADNQRLIDQSHTLLNQLQIDRPMSSFTAPSQSGFPGGLQTKPPAKAWDAGKWPVVLWPVLLYHLTPVPAG